MKGDRARVWSLEEIWRRIHPAKIKSSAAAGGFWTCFFNGFQRQTASLRSQTEANPGGKARKGGRLQRVQRFRHFGGGVPLVLQLGQEATTDGTQSFSGSIKPIYISSTTPKQPPPPPPKNLWDDAIASVWNLRLCGTRRLGYQLLRESEALMAQTSFFTAVRVDVA